MGKLRTPEQLKQLFQQTKERKQQELQRKREEKKRQYQQLCKQADQLLKDDQERFKKEKMEQLSALNPKTSQKPLKRFYYNLMNNRWIDDDKYLMDYTREELESMCPNCINWDAWDRLVAQVRQELGVSDTKPKKHKKKKTRLWTYTNGQPYKEYFDYSTAAREFGTTIGSMHQYGYRQLTIKGITFSNKPL